MTTTAAMTMGTGPVATIAMTYASPLPRPTLGSVAGSGAADALAGLLVLIAAVVSARRLGSRRSRRAGTRRRLAQVTAAA